MDGWWADACYQADPASADLLQFRAATSYCLAGRFTEPIGAADLGNRLLNAEDYLYYCPAYFAAQNAPFYGISEKLWVPWDVLD